MASRPIISFDVKWNVEEPSCKECSMCGALIVDDQFRLTLIETSNPKKGTKETEVLLCLSCFAEIGSEQ